MATDKIDLSNLTPRQQSLLQRAMARLVAEEAERGASQPEIDYSKEPVVMVASPAGSPPIAYRVEGDTLVDNAGNRYDNSKHKGFSICPQTGARLGHAPVAYNGMKIESLDDHVGLRAGDDAVLARYQPHTEAEEVA